MDYISNYVKDYFIIQNLEQPHRQEIHPLAVTDLRELDWQRLQHVEERVLQHLLTLEWECPRNV